MTPELFQRLRGLEHKEPFRKASSSKTALWELVHRLTPLAELYVGIEEALESVAFLLESLDAYSPPTASAYDHF